MATSPKDGQHVDKLISIKITSVEGFISSKCTYRIASKTAASELLKLVCALKKVNHNDYQLVYDDHTLVLESPLCDNQLNSSSKLYQTTLMTTKEAQELCLFPQRIVKVQQSTLQSAAMSSPTTPTPTPVALKPRPSIHVAAPALPVVDVKLRIEEKVSNQVIGCDITVKASTRFEKIKTMYCNHRGYQPDMYMFAKQGVIIESGLTLRQLGMTEPDKPYLINVYHKNVVNVASQD
ncbi:hypothetical protein AKO1_002846 [Acrasis kona]|uniref:TUG ubiquitin-like domain-containing protein n=1 Tax=Acrasis kona TaxID=1008807 RepID=A0AAW2YHC5_9EUKA